MRNAIGKFQPAITRETIEEECKTLITFNVAGTFEEFVQDSANQIL